MTPDSRWRPAQDRLSDIGCGFSLFVSFMILLMARPFPLQMRLLLIVGANALIFVIVMSIREKNENSVQKVVYVDTIAATQVIENVLNAKKFPFEKDRNGKHLHFILLSEGVELILTPYDPRGRNRHWVKAPASIIKIRAASPDNMLLVASLQEKLDDAFTPKGLE